MKNVWLSLFLLNSFLSFAQTPWDTNTNGIHYTNGNVGIGTPTPLAPLHIDINSESTMLRISTSKSGWHSSGDIGMDHRQMRLRTHTLEPIVFHPGDTGEKMRINSQGNVGIGCTDPTEKLTVKGSVKAEKIIV